VAGMGVNVKINMDNENQMLLPITPNFSFKNLKPRKSSASWRETMIYGAAANSVIRYSALPIIILTHFPTCCKDIFGI
jgi:hypothetical protein